MNARTSLPRRAGIVKRSHSPPNVVLNAQSARGQPSPLKKLKQRAGRGGITGDIGDNIGDNIVDNIADGGPGRVLLPTIDNIMLCSKLLASSSLVAFPTETVYGLGCSAFDKEAVRKCYEVKGRPRTSPLICHFSSVSEALEHVAYASRVDQEVFNLLTSSFSPGPITVIAPLRRDSSICRDVCNGGDLVGVRVPSHPLALKLLRMCKFPIAAPSANKFAHVSPTTSSHVLDDFGGDEGVTILNGEAKKEAFSVTRCEIGIESTVVTVKEGRVEIIRKGYITRDDIKRVVGDKAEVVDGAGGGVRPSRGGEQEGKRTCGQSQSFEEENCGKEERLEKDSQINEIDQDDDNNEALGGGDVAPGMCKKHYAPNGVTCYLVDFDGDGDGDGDGNQEEGDVKVFRRSDVGSISMLDCSGLALSRLNCSPSSFLSYIDMLPSSSPSSHLHSALFKNLRMLEGCPGDAVVVKVKGGGVEEAVMDRIWKACEGRRCRFL